MAPVKKETLHSSEHHTFYSWLAINLDEFQFHLVSGERTLKIEDNSYSSCWPLVFATMIGKSDGGKRYHHSKIILEQNFNFCLKVCNSNIF